MIRYSFRKVDDQYIGAKIYEKNAGKYIGEVTVSSTGTVYQIKGTSNQVLGEKRVTGMELVGYTEFFVAFMDMEQRVLYLYDKDFKEYQTIQFDNRCLNISSVTQDGRILVMFNSDNPIGIAVYHFNSSGYPDWRSIEELLADSKNKKKR